jgi:NAD(P)-dependent dehydrogenase (short-subunit alcohol dehydrogenase family)
VVVEPCDVTDAAAVETLAGRLHSAWGSVDVLVNAAGTNIPRRTWTDVSVADFARLVDVNLTGPFLVTRACLPLMRGRDGATVINIVSDAGLIGSAKAGAPYVASKFGLVGLSESLNAELRQEGIRACAICPGDIDTTLLDQRPVPPTAEQRAGMLQPEDLVACVMLVIDLPPRAIVEKLVVRPR